MTEATVTFRQTQAWDFARDAVAFPADRNATRIVCRISLEALQDNFAGRSLAPLDGFLSHRNAIEAKAAQLIENARFEPDGSILIRSDDGA